ncbi:MAG: LTA synthase family protein [gamma proteobacterium symbiont of Bathyaustriella thionipta]|nr:LTA synthase family protein [gamma proteobacterium symbiont of Bathyaustriella thionipta]
MVWYQSEIDSSISIYPALFLIGWLYDTAFYWYASIPLIFVLWLTPEKIWHSNVFQLLMKLWVIISIYILCFVVVSEFIFWDEFQVRFNFISVDYLVYRKEVMDNIQESYPVFTLLILMLPVTLMIFLSINKILEKTLKVNSSFSQRTVMTLALFISLFAVFKGVDQSQHSLFENNYTKELASNGPYQFFASFRNNELEYTQFYQEIDNLKADKIIRNSLKNGYSTFLYPDQLFNIERKIDNPGTEKKLNVILISIESLSAKYVGSFGNTENITPFLDQFSKESLFFTDFYATGTRTTRGLEAITLSIPPTPGRSVVKRIGHEGDMWSLGNILKSKGYQTTFIYGGRGYFDNMNSFFSQNGYDIVDQNDIPEDETKFANAWGVSDEDLYEETLKQADRAFKKQKPFFFHLMTTSNHRPYTYPGNKIDIPSGDGREGAVKYTDFAIKRFINWSKNKPWFKNTLFVVLADHCAGSAGREKLPIKKYHIPLWIYSPEHIKPQIIATRSGQIDVAPTLLGLLNMDYNSWFFGQDILKPNNNGMALIGNYQYLGLYQNTTLSILKPKKQTGQYLRTANQLSAEINQNLEVQNLELLEKTMAYYQSSAYALKNRLNSWSAKNKHSVKNGTEELYNKVSSK